MPSRLALLCPSSLNSKIYSRNGSPHHLPVRTTSAEGSSGGVQRRGALSRCPEYLPGKGEGVIGDDREGAEAESGDQEGREQRVQGGDVE